MTCYAAVLWPELWLQWKSDHTFWGCSGVCRHEHTWVEWVDSQFHIPYFCCCGNDNSSPPEKTMILVWASLQITHFIQPYRHATITKTRYNRQIQSQNIQLKWLPIVVAIVTDQQYRKSMFATDNIWPPMLLVNSLNWSIFVYLQMSILWGMWQ